MLIDDYNNWMLVLKGHSVRTHTCTGRNPTSQWLASKVTGFTVSAFSLPDLICDRTELKISLYGVVFRVEFDGDVHFCIAPKKPRQKCKKHAFSWKFPKYFKSVRMHLNASRCIRTRLNASEHVRAGQKTSENLPKRRKHCENFREGLFWIDLWASYDST